MLISRAKRAQAQQRITTASKKISHLDYSSDLEHMERRIQEMEARADAQTEVAEGRTSLDDQFQKLEQDDRVEQQLAALKSKQGKT